jgi:AAA15 family ATPase/GTPase
VNLIVGKNNVGKTALLEALWLFANGGDSTLMFEILRERNEIPPFQNGNTLVQPESSKGLRNLFNNRPHLNYVPEDIPDEYVEKLEMQIGESSNNETYLTKILKLTGRRELSESSDSIPSIKNDNYLDSKYNNYFLKANGISDNKLVEFWDYTEKFVLEDSIITALHIIAPNLKDIRFSGYPNGSFSRVPVVRLENAKERVPLRSLGDGMTRILGIALTLVRCESGILLIDEIETGLHYSALVDVWKLIFKTAKDLNVQVFATTHSKGCIEAFTQAAIDDEESEGMLIRLERNKDDKIIAKTIEEERLADAINYGAEVR